MSPTISPTNPYLPSGYEQPPPPAPTAANNVPAAQDAPLKPVEPANQASAPRTASEQARERQQRIHEKEGIERARSEAAHAAASQAAAKALPTGAQPDGSRIARDERGRVSSVAQPNGKRAGFDRDQAGAINRFGLGDGNIWERQTDAAKDGTATWKNQDGTRWRGSINVTDDGTIRTRGAGGETIIDRTGKRTDVAVSPYYKGVYTDKQDRVHSAVDPTGRSKTATYNQDGTLGKVEVRAHSNDQQPQTTYTRTADGSFVREENGKRQTGKLQFEQNGDLKFTDEATKETTVTAGSGATRVLDQQNRLKTVQQADGGRLDLTHDEQGLTAMKETSPDGRESHWKRREDGWSVGATAADADKGAASAGKITARASDGTIHIEGKAQDLYLKDNGQTVVHDKAKHTETTLDRDGKVRAASGRGGSWAFDYDQNGLSAVTFNALSASPNKFTRGAGDKWTNERGDAWTGKAEVRGDRVVFEEKDSHGKRTISEEAFASGRRRDYKPDDDPKHRHLEQKRDELIKSGKLPPNMTIGQFHEFQHQRSQAQLGFVNNQLQAHRNRFNQSALGRAAEYSDLGKEIIGDNKEIEDRSRELRDYLAAGDYQAFESKYAEYFPETGKTANGTPVLQPFVDVDKKISEYRSEKPSWEQFALNAAGGAIDKVEGIGKAIKEHPEYLALALPAAIPVVGWYYAAGLAIAGTATGGYEVGKGLNQAIDGYANSDHQKFYQGGRDIGGGSTDLALAFWGRPRGAAPKLGGNGDDAAGAAVPAAPQSPAAPRAAAQSKAQPPPEAQLPPAKKPIAPSQEWQQPVVGLESHNRYKLNQQLDDFIKQRAAKYFDEIRNTLDNAARNGGSKKPNGAATLGNQKPPAELVGAGVSPTPKVGNNAAPPPKIAQNKSAPPNETNAAGGAGSAATASPDAVSTAAKPLAEVLKLRGLADEQIAAVQKVVNQSDEVKNALEAAKGNVQLTERINQLIAQTAKKVDAAKDAGEFIKTLLKSFEGGHIPYSVEKNVGTIADAIPALKVIDPKNLSAGQVNRAILDKAYPEFSNLLKKLDKPEFKVLKEHIEKVLNGEKPDGKGGFTSGDKLNYKLDRKFDGAREDLMGHLNEVIGRNLRTADERSRFLQLWRESGASVQGLNTNAGSIGEHFFYQRLLGGAGFEKTKLPLGKGSTIDPDFGLNQGILGNIKTVGESVSPSKFGDLAALFKRLKTPAGRQEIHGALAKAHGDEAAAGFVNGLDSYVFHIQGNGKAALAEVESAAQATFRSSENFMATLPGGTRTNPPIRVTYEGANGKLFEVVRVGKELSSREVGDSISGLQLVKPAPKK